jgi:gas vesicle protein
MNRFLTTLLAGVAIGLLVAPAKGSETWRKLVSGLNDYKDKVSDEADNLMDSGAQAVKNGKSKLEVKAKDWADRVNS